jgi:hypothetical protein
MKRNFWVVGGSFFIVFILVVVSLSSAIGSQTQELSKIDESFDDISLKINDYNDDNNNNNNNFGILLYFILYFIKSVLYDMIHLPL